MYKLIAIVVAAMLSSGCFVAVCPNFLGTQHITIVDNDEPLIEGNTANADVSPLP